MIFFMPAKRSARRTAQGADAPDRDASGAGAPGGLPGGTAHWMARLAAGDEQALEALYRAEAPGVYRYVLACSGNPAWAAEAVQEAFVALAERPAAFDAARGSLGAYLAGVARHTLAAHWREAARLQPHAEPVDDPDDGPADLAQPSPEELMVRAQDLQALWAALRALPAPLREALVLVDLQERPYAEAAAIAGIELNTLRTRLHRARARLAHLLAPGGNLPRG